MKLLLYLLIVGIFLLLYILVKSSKQNIVITVLCSIIILEFIFKPKNCISWTLKGTKLFFMSVFPSLFPFLIISNLMIYYGGIQIYSKLLGNTLCRPLKLPKECSIVLIINALCGYPLGAKYACELYKENVIDYKTCERLLNIASSVSPLFLIGTVGTSMLNNTYSGYIILISSWISCIIMGLILPNTKSNFYYNSNNSKINNTSSNISNKNALRESIDNSIKNCLIIGGFVIIFYIITNIIKNNRLFNMYIKDISAFLHINPQIIEGLNLGLLEITNGCYLISLSDSNLIIKIALISFLVTFSGLSIILQVHSFFNTYNFSTKKYVLNKLLQSFICMATSIIISSFLTLLYYP